MQRIDVIPMTRLSECRWVLNVLTDNGIEDVLSMCSRDESPTMTQGSVQHDGSAIICDTADVVVLVDDFAQPVGTAPRAGVHTTTTPLHLAFSVYLIDGDGRVLLTRRALSKATWPGVWTNSCCGHLRPGESAVEAIHRRVPEELGVDVTGLRPLLPDFRYRAIDASGVVENEICPVFIGQINGTVTVDPDEVMETTWVTWEELATIAASTPRLLSPWCAAQVASLGDLRSVTASWDPKVGVPMLADTLSAVDDQLREACAQVEQTWSAVLAGHSDPILQGEDLPSWLGRLVIGHGKRIRPSMCHWGFVAGGGRAGTRGAGDMVSAAAALETLHCFALIHDDIMDESDLRRGEPSVHALAGRRHRQNSGVGSSDQYGLSIAILLGDLAHHVSEHLAATLPPALRAVWQDLTIELIAGQREDICASASTDLDARRAARIAAIKSGAYTIARPLQLGATAAGASEEVHRALASYGHQLGLAFALRDDVLGLWGDPMLTGKPVGIDLAQRKPTVLWEYATENLTGTPADLLRLVGSPESTQADRDELLVRFDDIGVRAWAENQIAEHVDQALAKLDAVPLPGDAHRGLVDMAGVIAWRQA
ncbi:isopentenyl-diphosphate Delta-isomerase [Arsenicicoccus piscis]|uniref:isopentenyl-diphosphate Delta-isomerase n=1 Tax=Arsenicicoccus piscis TaxID=673954 RepID=UPI0030C6EF2A